MKKLLFIITIFSSDLFADDLSKAINSSDLFKIRTILSQRTLSAGEFSAYLKQSQSVIESSKDSLKSAISFTDIIRFAAGTVSAFLGAISLTILAAELSSDGGTITKRQKLELILSTPLLFYFGCREMMRGLSKYDRNKKYSNSLAIEKLILTAERSS